MSCISVVKFLLIIHLLSMKVNIIFNLKSNRKLKTFSLNSIETFAPGVRFSSSVCQTPSSHHRQAMAFPSTAIKILTLEKQLTRIHSYDFSVSSTPPKLIPN